MNINQYAVFKVLLTDFISHLIKSCTDSIRLLIKNPGGLLLSHTVSSAVPSAVQALTFVFGMRTGVSPERIAT